jgi:cellulase/cellobiase CelA1
MSMMNLFVRPGDQFVRAGSSDTMVTAHAARRANGDLAVLLLNKDPENAHTVAIGYSGYAAAATATVHSHANGATSIATATGSATSQTLPPYSLTTLVLRPSTVVNGPPGAPGAPAASAVTDRTATVSWPAAARGTHPIAKYEVYRQFGAVSEQWGETTGTSLSVGNLNPGSRYTVNVVARDTAGNVSWASPPLTFVTGSPAASTCTVRFSTANDWGNGYIGNIDVTNSGTAVIDGWTLTYSWPTGWQRVDGGWNAGWEQTGRAVRVTNADFNRRLEPGASASAGFVGNYSGPNVLPSAFTLNGIPCTTTS